MGGGAAALASYIASRQAVIAAADHPVVLILACACSTSARMPTRAYCFGLAHVVSVRGLGGSGAHCKRGDNVAGARGKPHRRRAGEA